MWRAALVVAGLLVLGLLPLAGCGTSHPAEPQRQVAAAELADVLREEALKLPDAPSRDRLVTGLVQVRELLTEPGSPLKGDEPAKPGEPKLPSPPGGARPTAAWTTMFMPANLIIGFFTRSRDFDGAPGDDGLEVRLQPMDQFGDPTKAVGSYRIEVYEYRLHSTDKRGVRLGHWFISVLDAESNRKYYDSVDRSYVFPLLWDKPIKAGTSVIVQATYYPPAGFQQKLVAQRVVKVGGEEDTALEP
jgi:hypothetical protein